MYHSEDESIQNMLGAMAQEKNSLIPEQCENRQNKFETYH